jgi:hypothetical protein
MPVDSVVFTCRSVCLVLLRVKFGDDYGRVFGG